MRCVAIAGCLLLAACELPPLTLKFKLTGGKSQQCMSPEGDPATRCSDITMLCEGVLSVRIVAPSDPTVPYVHLCEPLRGAQNTLCSIATIDLPDPVEPIPEQVLEVQMAVFPRSAVSTDPDTGKLVCPRVEYAADNLPVLTLPTCIETDLDSCPKIPAVGGRTFYRPGDTETVVELGCSDLPQLTDELTCEGTRRISVTATVNDFDDLVSSVDKQLAGRLTVGVGEPRPQGDRYVLTPGDGRDLVPAETMAAPAWSGELTDLAFSQYACLEVLEDGAQTTTALTCRRVDPASNTLDMAGVYLKKSTLDQILGALGLVDFPSEGLVVGMVLDQFFNPQAGTMVSCEACTIQYLSADRTGLVAGGTSASGIFMSTDAPFGTEFTTGTTLLRPVFGGLVESKVTIVVIQDKIVIEPD